MREYRNGFGLIAEQLEGARLVAPAFRKNLYRDMPLEGFLETLEHEPHGAPADFFDYGDRAEFFPDVFGAVYVSYLAHNTSGHGYLVIIDILV
jgi:hypothetical protein